MAGAPNGLERLAVQRVIDMATAAGVPVPDEIAGLLTRVPLNTGAWLWVREHPDDDEGGLGCCDGDAVKGPEHCTCWIPEWNGDQAPPNNPPDPADFGPRERMCSDCAFRPGSTERRDGFVADALYDLPAGGKPFYCHDGLRRPLRWRHPDGRTVEGSPDDWQPVQVNGVPFRLDGRAALLCAGWAAVARRLPDPPPPLTKEG